LGGSGSVAVFVSQIVTAQLINLARQDRSRPQTPSLPARLTTTALRRQRTSLLFEASSAMRPKLTRLQSPTRIPAAALRVCEAPDFLGEEREGGGFLLPPACPNAVHMGADLEPYCATDTDSDRGARSRRSARGPQPRRSFSLVREDSRSPQRFLTVRWWAHKGSNLGPAD
jgi:hypothetical protein